MERDPVEDSTPLGSLFTPSLLARQVIRRDAPDHIPDIVGDQQSAAGIECDTDRTTMRFAAALVQKSREDIERWP